MHFLDKELLGRLYALSLFTFNPISNLYFCVHIVIALSRYIIETADTQNTATKYLKLLRFLLFGFFCVFFLFFFLGGGGYFGSVVKNTCSYVYK